MPFSPSIAALVCHRCKGLLEGTAEGLFCASCQVHYSCTDDIVDFSQGLYYDNFTGPEVLTAENQQGLANEAEGARIEDFYLPHLDRLARRTGTDLRALRVLDSGCGNGESIDILRGKQLDAWGHDLSALRKWQWRERRHRDRLVVSDGASLPFPDGFFDAVIASGVLEHIGVSELGGSRYQVRPLPNRDELRRCYVAELVRVTSRRGLIFLDFPNGAFPVDFWHGVTPGGARLHSSREGFLPTVSEIRSLCGRIEGGLTVTVLSPERRLRFRQVSSHWYGRLFRAPMAVLQKSMSTRLFRFLAASPINPYLVIEISRPGSR